MKFPRASGILLHPTSLPNEYGIGDFGKSAYEFVDFLEHSKQTYWQVLPLGPTGFGDSPYQSFSAFAGNTNLISPETLIEEGLLKEEDLEEKPEFPTGKVDFGKVIRWKDEILKKAFNRFRLATDGNLLQSFELFDAEADAWLNDYSFFRAIKNTQSNKNWLEWDEPLRKRNEEALCVVREDISKEIQAQKFYQFLFFKQWTLLKNYAKGKGVKIIGDIPIFISLDSADVWCNPREFKLNDDLSPKVVAGVPPDYFSKTGQLWGNPIYDWEKMRGDGFKWWISRIKFALKTFDILRIDHFRGFGAAWEVPAEDKTAENGAWVNVPGREMFQAFIDELGELPFMAEDLGEIAPDVEKLRDEFGFPGMRILLFGFGDDAGNLHLPHNYIQNSVAYTGTHDNDTSIGWLELQKKKDKKRCLKYLDSNGKKVHWDFIRGVWSSVANTAIVPMQDVLGLGNNSRMNLPSTKSGNWNWRCEKGCFSDELAEKLLDLTEVYGRTNS